jgi:hypothetical protein
LKPGLALLDFFFGLLAEKIISEIRVVADADYSSQHLSVAEFVNDLLVSQFSFIISQTIFHS